MRADTGEEERRYDDNRGRIVEMLIVHSQSSIKFNSHSASTCYSNSVTEDTSGMCSYFSLTSLLFLFIMTSLSSLCLLLLFIPSAIVGTERE